MQLSIHERRNQIGSVEIRIDMNCTFVNKTLQFTILKSNLESEGLHCMIHKVLFMRFVSDIVSIGSWNNVSTYVHCRKLSLSRTDQSSHHGHLIWAFWSLRQGYKKGDDHIIANEWFVNIMTYTKMTNLVFSEEED